MANERFERFYRPEQKLTPDEALGRSAGDAIKRHFESGLIDLRSGNAASAANHAETLIDNVLIYDRMERTRIRFVQKDLRKLGEAEFIHETHRRVLAAADTSNNSTRVLELIRVGHLFGYDEARKRAQKAEAEATALYYRSLWEHHSQLWQAAQTARTPGAGVAGGTGPAAPEDEPEDKWQLEPEDGKSDEYKAAKNLIRQEYDRISRQRLLINADSDPGASETLKRYEAAMDVFHPLILKPETEIQAIRAMLDYLMPEIWSKPSIVGIWMRRQFPQGRVVPSTFLDVRIAVKYTFAPKELREKTSFTRAESTNIRRIKNKLAQGLHSDTREADPDADKSLSKPMLEWTKAVNIGYSQVTPFLR